VSAIAPGLWLVATPIGNLDDMSARAADVLRAADVVCCEDTRRSSTLLRHIGARPERLLVANDHTEHDLAPAVVAELAAGRIVAVVTDAGTPGVSDPGERLVAAAIEAGHAVHSTPGPAAFVMAAVLSGLPTARLAFDGFLPRSGADRRERLTEIARERRTTVLYEAPHRLVRTLTDLVEACGTVRRVAVVREMTKIHEEIWRGTLEHALAHAQSVEPRGEYAIVIEPCPDATADVSDDVIAGELARRTLAGLSTRDAVDEVSTALGVARNRVYDLAVRK
jgi:16S rRNA (cytidine1402-2'-O)-methyltransferase